MTTKKTTKKATRKSTAGRPRGSKTETPDVALLAEDCCAKCGSPNREPYWGRTEVHATGVLPDGRGYSRMVTRRTKCTDCGQVRFVKFALPNVTN